MKPSIKKDRFIPLRKTDLIQACLEDGRLPVNNTMNLKRFVS